MPRSHDELVATAPTLFIFIDLLHIFKGDEFLFVGIDLADFVHALDSFWETFLGDKKLWSLLKIEN